MSERCDHCLRGKIIVRDTMIVRDAMIA
jgi:hypothetical protein